MFQQLGDRRLVWPVGRVCNGSTAASGMAGMRTFPLITVLGSLAAILANHFDDSWILAAGLLAIVAIVVVGHLFRPQPDRTRAPRPTWQCC